MSKRSFAPTWSRRQLLLASAAATVSAASASPARALLSVLEDRLAAIETIVERKRKELGIPGAALAIVKDGAVVMLKGFGSRDLAGTMPVTPDTLFAIASNTKAFTGMAAVMSQEAGRLSLEDSPKKYLPYFTLRDPDADARITLRDLLVHNCGLMRADMLLNGVLSREEIVQVAAIAKPTSKFREAFQYHNTMYIAAGEAIGKAHSSTWEDVIAQNILAPLGMTATTTTIEAMRRAADFALGYDKVGDKLEPAALIDRSHLAAAGGMTSNVKDMAQWLRLLLAGGELDGKRLVSPQGFAQMTRKHISAGIADYGLGLFLGRRGKSKTIWHGGNVEGFESQVFFAPEHRIGFVLLTNIGSSQLPNVTANAVWSHLVEGAPISVLTDTADPRSEIGRYAAVGAGIEIVLREDKLFAVISGQPEYPLIPDGGRKYRLGAPAPDGFSITFRASASGAGGNELLIQQPHGSVVLQRLRPASANGGLAPAETELLGTYRLGNVPVLIEGKGDFAQVLLPGQNPYTLVQQSTDLFALAELPATFRLGVTRAADGQVVGIVFKQPQGEFPALRVVGAANALDMTIEQLMAKVIAAIGGEENLRKRRRLKTTSEIELENLGITGKSLATAFIPDTSNSVVTLFAFDKEIGVTRQSCTGNVSRTETSFATGTHTGVCTSDLDFTGLLNWKNRWESVTLQRKTKIGDEEAYVVLKSSKNLRETDTISAKSFLLLQRETEAPLAGTMIRISTERYAEYREVEGVKIPVRSEAQHVLLGRILSRVTDIQFEAPAEV